MSPGSYTRNLGRVLLARALSGIERGLYIDIGSEDFVEDSATKDFYNSGWNGINVSRTICRYRRLVAERPLDLNVLVVPGEGAHKPLHDIVHGKLLSGENIHLLRIDCASVESSVLQGIGLDQLRPWIVLLESILQDPIDAEWQSGLTTHGYHLVYSAGPDRFYVANGRRDLEGAFTTNWTAQNSSAGDTPSQQSLADIESCLSTLHDRLEDVCAENEQAAVALEGERRAREGLERHRLFMHSELDRLRREVDQKEQELARLREIIEAMQCSTSWRITSPLRMVMRGMRLGKQAAPRLAYHLARWPAYLARPLLRLIARSLTVRKLAGRLVRRDSKIATLVQLFLFGVSPIPEISRSQPVMTRKALRVFEEIERARSRSQGN